jgi:hypothetical protein
MGALSLERVRPCGTNRVVPTVGASAGLVVSRAQHGQQNATRSAGGVVWRDKFRQALYWRSFQVTVFLNASTVPTRRTSAHVPL